MFSGSPASHPKVSGCPTRASHPIVAADRIAVLGAGSVGCLIGGCWQAAGLPVSFIGRPRIANDIAMHGLTVS
ncbi:MAG: 2-dehydropantoate 2-reductase N-terminal domain-containing protein, partial [Sphingomicrobium sp.]